MLKIHTNIMQGLSITAKKFIVSCIGVQTLPLFVKFYIKEI